MLLFPVFLRKLEKKATKYIFVGFKEIIIKDEIVVIFKSYGFWLLAVGYWSLAISIRVRKPVTHSLLLTPYSSLNLNLNLWLLELRNIHSGMQIRNP
jgi:hypothetical protein